MALCQLGLICASGLNLLGPLLFAHAIDKEIPEADKTGLIWTAVILLVLLLGNLALSYFSRIGSEMAAQGAMYRLKKKLLGFV